VSWGSAKAFARGHVMMLAHCAAGRSGRAARVTTTCAAAGSTGRRFLSLVRSSFLVLMRGGEFADRCWDRKSRTDEWTFDLSHSRCATFGPPGGGHCVRPLEYQSLRAAGGRKLLRSFAFLPDRCRPRRCGLPRCAKANACTADYRTGAGHARAVLPARVMHMSPARRAIAAPDI